jgi:hypothetical protein
MRTVVARPIRLARMGWRVIRVLSVGLIGAVLRCGRRLLGLRPRIWHGTRALHTVSGLAAINQCAGYRSTSVVRKLDGFSYEYVRKDEFDVVLKEQGIPPSLWGWRSLEHLLLHGDIWVAFFDCLFFETPLLDVFAFKLIRALGIRIVMLTYGGDVIHWKPRASRYDWLSRLRDDYPNWDLVAYGAVCRNRVGLFERYANFICVPDLEQAWFINRYDLCFKYFPVDCTSFVPVYRTENKVPVILHAPNHRLVKGTDYLSQALERLALKGFEFDLRLVERVPRTIAYKMYAEADIIADQFCIGAWGCFAQEGLALGKPTLVYLDRDHLSDRTCSLPLVNATPDNLEEVLAVLVCLPQLRERIGRASRSSVERYQSVRALAEVWGQIYEHVWFDRPLQLEKTRHFSPTRRARSLCEDPGQAEFWPVDVSDLLGDIRAVLEKGRAGVPESPAVGEPQ